LRRKNRSGSRSTYILKRFKTLLTYQEEAISSLLVSQLFLTSVRSRQKRISMGASPHGFEAGSSNESAVLALRRTAAGDGSGREGMLLEDRISFPVAAGVEFLPPLWRDLLQATRPPSSCCLAYALPLLPVFSFHFCFTSTRARARKSSNSSGIFLPNFFFSLDLHCPTLPLHGRFLRTSTFQGTGGPPICATPSQAVPYPLPLPYT
jgi:hypothetical protein